MNRSILPIHGTKKNNEENKPNELFIIFSFILNGLKYITLKIINLQKRRIVEFVPGIFFF